MSSSPTGRRERAKAERRDAILNATLTLIDRPGADREHASVEAIAREAGVAPATVYNLFGTRDAILGSLAHRMASKTVDLAQDARSAQLHPLHSLLMPIDLVCAHFNDRPRAWSHVILRLGDIAATTPAEATNGRDFSVLLASHWRDAQTSGVIRTTFSPAALALQTYATTNGALMRWAAGRISHDTLRLLLRHTILLVATATASDSHASALAEELLTTGTELASTLDQPTKS